MCVDVADQVVTCIKALHKFVMEVWLELGSRGLTLSLAEIEGTEERSILLDVKGSSVSNNGRYCGGGAVIWFDIICGVEEWAMVKVVFIGKPMRINMTVKNDYLTCVVFDKQNSLLIVLWLPKNTW